MKIVLNWQHLRLILYRNGYRSWTVEWSHGQTLLPNGRMKNLWHFPRFYHIDINKHFRKLYESHNT